MPSYAIRAGVSRRGYNRSTLPVAVFDWSHGIVRDADRVALPDGSLYDATDFLLHKPGIAFKRGGTSYAGPVMGSATYAATVTYAEFATPQLIAIGDDGHFYKITSGTTTDVATLGSGFPPLQTPILRTGATTLLVIPGNDGATAPKKYDGTTVAALGGSSPNGKYAAVYATRLVLGNTSANPNRLFFSPTPDITATWDTTNSWIDCDYAITGLAAISNALLVFSQSHIERITGFTPPPGSDMSRGTVASIGCSDARSIAIKDNTVVFANPRGIYVTAGAGFDCLTALGGIETYWQSQLSGYDPASWTIASGIYRSFLYVTVMNGSTLVDTLVCDLSRRDYPWIRLTNVKARMYATGLGLSEELYYADRSAARAVGCSGMFAPASGNKNDANGTAVAPMMEFSQVGDGSWLKHFGFGHLSYDMRDAASDNPTLALTVAAGAEATTYAAVTESPLAETTDETRTRFTVGKVSQAVNLKITQSNASSKTEIRSLEVEQRYLNPSAGGQ